MEKPSPPSRGDSSETPAERFLRSARQCRARDLQQLAFLSELVKDIGALIHALQKERGVSSIYLGSNGAQFAGHLAARVQESQALGHSVSARMALLEQHLGAIGSGARFFTRVGFAFLALSGLPEVRRQITSLTLAPQDAIKFFSDLIGSLLAVIFESADVAAEPAIARALVALVNFVRGKEFAGQERALGGAAFSRGRFDGADLRRFQQMIAAQDQSFHIFAEFADPARATAFRDICSAHELESMRQTAVQGGLSGALGQVTAADWYEKTTNRINAMKIVEDQMAADLQALCAQKLAELEQEPADHPQTPAPVLSVAVMVMDAAGLQNNTDPDGKQILYSLEGLPPGLMRSILDVVQAQSRRLLDLTDQLETARTALNERKIIDRAKGLLMKTRKLTEQQAYTLLRQTAMNQNKRIFEVAESIVNVAAMLSE